MLFKILHGDESRISTDITPFHEGWAYVTHSGNFYVDMNIGTVEAPNNQRIKLNAKDAETIAGVSLDELRALISNQDAAVLAEAQQYTDNAIANIDITEGFSGSYNDLTDKPEIPTVPTNVGAFENDAGYLTAVPEEYITETELNDALAVAQSDASNKAAVVLAESQSYTDTQIGNIAEVLQAILDLQNGYLTPDVPAESEWMEYDLDEDGGVTVSGLQGGTYQVKARNMGSAEYDIDADSTWIYNPDTAGEELILFWNGMESVAVIPQGDGAVRFMRNMPIDGIALKKVG